MKQLQTKFSCCDSILNPVGIQYFLKSIGNPYNIKSYKCPLGRFTRLLCIPMGWI